MPDRIVRPNTVRVAVSVGLERVLYLAASVPSFRKAILQDREAALDKAGLSLSNGEAEVLAAVDRDTLASMIDAVAPRSRPQRPFLRSVAMTFITLATSTAEVGCEPSGVNGIQPDWDADRDHVAVLDVLNFGDPGGDRGDWPEPLPEIAAEVPELGWDVGFLDDPHADPYDTGSLAPEVAEATPPSDAAVASDTPDALEVPVTADVPIPH